MSPLFNDPYYRTIGIGTRIFLGGGVGYVVFPGTQHNPGKPRSEHGVPLGPAGTLFLMGDLKKMTSRYLVGVSLLGYGCSLSVGVGVPIPMLNEEIAHFCGLSDEELLAPIVDYGSDYPAGTGRILGQVSYAQLKRGHLILEGQEVPTVPLSSYGAGPGDRPSPEGLDHLRPVPAGRTGGTAARQRPDPLRPHRQPGQLSFKFRVSRCVGRASGPALPFVPVSAWNPP